MSRDLESRMRRIETRRENERAERIRACGSIEDALRSLNDADFEQWWTWRMSEIGPENRARVEEMLEKALLRAEGHTPLASR